MNNYYENQENPIIELNHKIMKQVKNNLYFKHKALSPAIYRMPIVMNMDMPGVMGTDASNIYVSPMSLIFKYKENPTLINRTYLHMLFHCIYMHPFLPMRKDIDTSVWNLALDICAEAAVLRLEPEPLPEDGKKKEVIEKMKSNVKLFLPELVYKELQQLLGSGQYTHEELSKIFELDVHIWIDGDSEDGQGGGNQGKKSSKSKNKKSSKKSKKNKNGKKDDKDDEDDGDGNGDGDNEDEDDDGDNNDGDGNGSGDDDDDNEGDGDDGDGDGDGDDDNGENESEQDGSSGSSSRSQQEKQQEWRDVSQQISADLQSFHKQRGDKAGDFAKEIDYLTADKMDYEEFLKQFAVMDEKMMVNMDEFDYMYYTYGLSMPGEKKKLLIEPLEYKETKVVKEFVIAIDTSGSVQGELVKKFLNKTYSILKDCENFASKVNIHIIQCDASIQNDTKIENKEQMEEFMQHMKLYGFGGTDFRPVFEYVDDLIKKKEFTNLCGLLYFTDGYGVYPTKPTPYKTAFVFMEDYNRRDVPPWAMQIDWKNEC